MSQELSQVSVRFDMNLDRTGSIHWFAYYEKDDSAGNRDSDSADAGGIPLHQRREPLRTTPSDDMTALTDFERRWRVLTFQAEEWGWLNGSGQ